MIGTSIAREPQAKHIQLPGIDVLRGVSALGVVWFHSRVDLWVGFKEIQANPTAYSYFDRALSYLSLPASQMGGIVMLFFVLSGFCIHLPIASRNSSPNWAAYAVRRFFRIYPAYLATLLFCFLAAVVFFRDGGDLVGQLSVYAASAVMIQNWVMGGSQIALNPSLWTIPVELEAYIFYPLLLWFWRQHGLSGALALTLFCTAIGAIMFTGGHGQASATFFKYAVIWNSGAWLAEAYVRGFLPKWSSWHWLVMAGTAAATMTAGLAGVDIFYLHYGWALVSLLLLLWVLGPGSRFFTLGRWWVPPLMFTGTVSYSLYLLHFPLFKLAGHAWVEVYGSKPESFLIPSIATFLVIPFAWFFYRVVELPTHQLARNLGGAIQRVSPIPSS
jgi:peptidoglycan/LPS O-acetylase OafA/YrhL